MTGTRRSLGVSVIALALALAATTIATTIAAPRPAAADTLNATRGQDLRETKHTVDVEVRRGLAYYKVRRVFRNRGKRAEEARLVINLPHGAVATGLRIKGKKRWHVGELMQAGKAEELYAELTGMGPNEPKDPALLYWRWTDELALRVFPIFPGTSSTVEYTLTAPTSYADGYYYLDYGRKPAAKNLATPRLRMRGDNIARFEVDGESSKRAVDLGPIRLHKVLIDNEITNPKVLVRSIRVRGQKTWNKVALNVSIQHTWRGDIEIALVGPDGELRDVRPYDLSDGENNLKTHVSLEYNGDPNGLWYLLITDHHPLDGGRLERWSVSADQPRARRFRSRKPAFIPQPSESRPGRATLGVRFKRDATAVRLGRVGLLPKKQFARFEIDVAHRLSELPRPLSVSFVLDVSHTMDDEGIAAELDIVAAYLSHVPWARFSLVAFGRRGTSLTGGFVPAKQLKNIRATLEKSKALAPRNGSFLDRGISAAVPALAARKGSSALIIMTDDRLRPTWNNSEALSGLRALPKKTVVHVVDVEPDGDLELTRDDDHRLFPLAKLRHGVAIHANGIGEAKPSELRTASLYLVRPTRLDHVNLVGFEAAGNIQLAENADGVLAEGAGARWMAPMKRAPRNVTLNAQLWSKPVHFTVRSNDEPFNMATAGFVFSLDFFDKLSETEQFMLAMYARAVTPVTSYLAIEPGVRPSIIGLERGTAGFGSIGSGRYGTTGYSTTFSMDWAPIAARAARACRKHGAGRVDVILQLQSHEITDIGLGSAGPENARDRCVIEALWGAVIPRSPRQQKDWSKDLRVVVGA